MGFLFGSPKTQAIAPAIVTKPISPVTNRATVEGTIRKRQRSLIAEKPKSLLNEETGPLG